MAVLIDDNTQLSKLEAILHEVSTYGRIVVKKAYGNWKKEMLKLGARIKTFGNQGGATI